MAATGLANKRRMARRGVSNVAVQPPPIPRSEDLRPELTKIVAQLAPDGVIDIRSGRGKLTYQLAAPSVALPDELQPVIRLSANAARAEWSDARAYARIAGVVFVLQVDGVDRAVFRRHPDYVPGKLGEMVERHRRQLADQHETVAPAGTAEGEADLLRAVRLLEERVARLEASRLENRTTKRG
jgi:hypothetical protein